MSPRPERRQRRRFAPALAGLEELGERIGAVLGDTYALAATSVLSRWEQLEDRNAERRYRQRHPRPSASRNPLPPTK